MIPDQDLEANEDDRKKNVRDVQNKEAIGERIVFDYSKLISQSSNESRGLKSIIDRIPEGKELLIHPVVEAFIMMKWFKFIWFWFLWMLIKLLFISFFVSKWSHSEN